MGEFVITLEGNKKLNEDSKKISLNIESQIKKLMKKNSLTDVVEIVHNLTNVSKKAIYKKALDLKKQLLFVWFRKIRLWSNLRTKKPQLLILFRNYNG